MFTSDTNYASLLVFLNIAPLGLYFLVLGLVNSHARPHRVSSRGDFAALAIVCVPLLCWPIPSLLTGRLWGLLAAGIAAAALAFARLLPPRHGGWVIYNISEGRCRAIVNAAVRGLGLRGEWRGQTWTDTGRRLSVTCTPFGLLRNVSVNVSQPGGSADGWEPRFLDSLDRELAACEQLPAAAGVCLLTLGVGLMLGPLWLLGRHASDVAAAVARLLG